MRKSLTTLALSTALALTGGLATTNRAQAQEPCYLGMVFLFAGNFAPRGYAFAQGQLLQIQQNSALFSLLGTTYGGDGRTTFGLPDLRGRVPVGVGTGPGLTNRALGQRFGTETSTGAVSGVNAHSHGLAEHSHALRATTTGGDLTSPSGALLADDGSDRIYSTANVANPDATMAGSAIAPSGGNTGDAGSGASASVPTLPPSLGLNYVICTQGLYPSRS